VFSIHLRPPSATRIELGAVARPRVDDARIHVGDDVQRLRIVAGNDLADVLEGVARVAGLIRSGL